MKNSAVLPLIVAALIIAAQMNVASTPHIVWVESDTRIFITAPLLIILAFFIATVLADRMKRT